MLCSGHSRMSPRHLVELNIHTKHYEASVRICGTQRILGCAAIHGAIELSWHSLQNQLLPLSLSAAVQEAPPDSCPGEQGLGEYLILSTPIIHVGWRQKQWKKERETEREKEVRVHIKMCFL